MKIVIIPGYSSSVGEHWQAWLHEEIDDALMVLQDDWVYPEKSAWVAGLRNYLDNLSEEKILLVAHSLGCVTLAALCEDGYDASHIAGALLVAPADSEQEDFPQDIRGFEKMPRGKIPFPTTLIGSRDDHYMTFDRASYFAHCWGSEFVDYGEVGHINTASGFGPWPEVIQFIARLTQ